MRHPRSPISIDGPNVEEIRRIRAKLSKRFDNDLGKLCEHLRQIETQYRDRVVQPRKVSSMKPRRDVAGKQR